MMMTILSALLMVLAKRQQSTSQNLGMGWEVPARMINSLVNGPGFYFGRLIYIPTPNAVNENLSYDADRLLGVALFWFLIGLSIERRRNKQALDRQHPIHAAILFAVASLLCGGLGFAGIAHVFCPSPNMACWDQSSRMVWPVLSAIAKYPLRTQSTMELCVVAWLLAFCAYFAGRALSAARRSLATTT